MNMNDKLNDVLMNVRRLLDTGEINKKINTIRAEYELNEKLEAGLSTVFGHSFSMESFMKFEQGVNKRTKNHEGDFRQLLNKLMFEKDMTQSVLSRLSMIKETTLSRYINGSRDVPAYAIFRIALTMKLTVVETETLLRKVGKSLKAVTLDAVVIESIEQGIYDVFIVEAIVRKFSDGRESLFTKKEQIEYEFSEEDFEIDII